MEDYKAALDYIRGPDLSGIVDSSRVALWGTSFSGGHVLNVAAADNVPSRVGGIRAIVSQVTRKVASSEGGESRARRSGGKACCLMCRFLCRIRYLIIGHESRWSQFFIREAPTRGATRRVVAGCLLLVAGGGRSSGTHRKGWLIRVPFSA